MINTSFFPDGTKIITGRDFYSVISGEEYLVIALDMRAFHSEDEAIQDREVQTKPGCIDSYEDFRNSSCQIDPAPDNCTTNKVRGNMLK